jgi:hypothetical protein
MHDTGKKREFVGIKTLGVLSLSYFALVLLILDSTSIADPRFLDDRLFSSEYICVEGHSLPGRRRRDIARTMRIVPLLALDTLFILNLSRKS